MTDLTIRMAYVTHRMMADDTARVTMELGEAQTRQLLFLLAEGALERGTLIDSTVVDEDAVKSTGAGP